MTPRLSGRTSMFGSVFFVSKSLLGNERQRKLKNLAILTWKPQTAVRILIYQTWPISCGLRFSYVSRALLWLVQNQINLLESNPNVHSSLSFTVKKGNYINFKSTLQIPHISKFYGEATISGHGIIYGTIWGSPLVLVASAAQSGGSPTGQDHLQACTVPINDYSLIFH